MRARVAVYPCALEPDSIFAKDFRVVRGLRVGGMGAVYVVTQLSTGKQRALKILASQLVNNTDMRERFVREAQAAAEIESDHVVEVVTAGVDDETGTPYIVMELLRGEELADAVDRRGAFPIGEVREVLEQIGDALAQAHAQRIVHRDLKPENIFLALPRRRGAPFTAKLLDFGVAKFLALGASEMGTAPVGSPLFMAPEQTDPFGNICPATDVWALGLLAFYLLTGKSYWLGAERASVPVLLREVCLDPLVSASSRAHQLGVPELIPEGFDAWFETCVVREIESRYVEGGEAIEAFLAAVPEDAVPQHSEHPPVSLVDAYDPYAIPPSGPQEEPSADDDDSASAAPMGPTLLANGGSAEPAEETSVPDEEDSEPRVTPIESAADVVPIVNAPPETPRSKWRARLRVVAFGVGIGAALGGIVGFVTRTVGHGSSKPSSVAPSVEASADADEPSDAGATTASSSSKNDRDTQTSPCPRTMILFAGGPGPDGPVAPYCLDRTEVTVHAWSRCVSAGVCEDPTDTVSYPVIVPRVLPFYRDLCNVEGSPPNDPQNCVDWWAAEDYCLWMRGRLPTEAEWALAALSTESALAEKSLSKKTAPKTASTVDATAPKSSASTLSGNDKKNITAMIPKATANRCGDECVDWGLARGIFMRTNATISDGFQGTSPVETFAKFAGFPADLDGNVAEWTQSRDESSSAPHDDRVVLGLAFMPLSQSDPSAARAVVPASAQSHLIGFRCVMTPRDPVDD